MFNCDRRQVDVMRDAEKIREFGGDRTRQTERDKPVKSYETEMRQAGQLAREHGASPQLSMWAGSACLSWERPGGGDIKTVFQSWAEFQAFVEGFMTGPEKSEKPVATERGRQKARGAT